MGKRQESYNICDSAVCLQRAQQIKKSLDPSVDPCEDFYSYACGGWLRSNTIPESQPALIPIGIISSEVNQALRVILGNMTIVQGDHQRPTDKVALAYKACLAVPEAGDQPTAMWQIMNDYGLADWPLLGDEQQRRTKHLDWTEMLRNVGISPVLQLFIERDTENKPSRIIELEEIYFSIIGRNELIHPNRAHSKPIIAAYKKLIAAAATFIRPSITESQAAKLANDIVDFEGGLANLTAPPEERHDGLKLYHRTTIGALQRNVSGFPLLTLLNKEFSKVNIRLNEDEPIGMKSLDYYTRLPLFLMEAKPATFFNYLGIKIMLILAKDASEAIRNASFELMKAKIGVEKDAPRWEKCVNLLNDEMETVVSYLYVRKKFSKDAKREVEEFVRAIKDSFNESLRSITWMDDRTKHHAAYKLQKMGWKIAYPEWLLDPTSLDQFYKYIPKLDPSTPFVSIWKSLRDNKWKTALAELRIPYDPDKVWKPGAAVVDAFYHGSTNEMVFPAAILQGVFYQYGLPRSLGMGSLGFVAGHELTHGFDDTGSQYDADGRLRQWWSNDSRSNFEKKSECFKQQYGSIYVKEAGLKLNGKNTVSEDIADNGGIRAAFRAYKKMFKEKGKGKDTRLRGLEELSGDKLFFIAEAMLWCSLYRPEGLRSVVQYDSHSPPKYRVNVPMANMDEFSKVWNCPAHSGMNPDRSERCSLW